MLQTLLGVDGFRRGMDLYFERHDGQAVTCEAFVAAMADANGRDLGQFLRWYATAGTPRLQVRSQYDAANKRLVLSLTQLLPDAEGHAMPAGERALHIPVDVALLARDSGQVQRRRLLELTASQQDFVFEGVESADARGPMLSLLRDFSAPVVVDHPYSDEDLAFLLRHDDNLFNRWEAGQQLAERALLQAIRQGDAQATLKALSDALAATLPDARLDDGLRQQFLMLPEEKRLAEQLEPLDPSLLRTRPSGRTAHPGAAAGALPAGRGGPPALACRLFAGRPRSGAARAGQHGPATAHPGGCRRRGTAGTRAVRGRQQPDRPAGRAAGPGAVRSG